MYKHDGQDIFVIDGHMHFWDANPENGGTSTAKAGLTVSMRTIAASARPTRYGPLKSFVSMARSVG